MDIYRDNSIKISIYRYSQRFPYATFRYLQVHILFKMRISIFWISRFGLGISIFISIYRYLYLYLDIDILRDIHMHYLDI